MIDLRCGDCLEVMRGMEEACVDTIITDPPYGLSFMGKDWDHGVPGIPFWEAALRVAKPGATLLAFGGTRTSHRLTCAIEDAGWEIRDTIMWLYGSGFPKSHDISKAIDKAAGAEREVVGVSPYSTHRNSISFQGISGKSGAEGDRMLTSPATPEAAEWDGWGTALKPAYEIICMAMKPIDSTFAANALKWGVAGLNIDGGRIPHDEGLKTTNRDNHLNKRCMSGGTKYGGEGLASPSPAGRWPANVILDEAAAAALDEQSGVTRSTAQVRHNGSFKSVAKGQEYPRESYGFMDAGGASRFFYCPKASRSERDAGLEGCEYHTGAELTDRKPGTAGLDNPRAGAGRTSGGRNIHPTVKPLALMRYLCTLTATPAGGVVLDPFMGSGSTGIAAKQTGRNFIGIEIDPNYFEIARRRIEYARVDAQLRLEGV